MRRLLFLLVSVAALGGCTRLSPAETCEARGLMLAGDANNDTGCAPFDARAGCHGDMECILGNECVHDVKQKILASRYNVGGWRLFDSSTKREARKAELFSEVHKCRFGAQHFHGMKSDDGK